MSSPSPEAPARPDWWHDFPLRQIRAVAAGMDLFDHDLAVTEWDCRKLDQMIATRAAALAERIGHQPDTWAELPVMNKYDLRERPEKFRTGLIDPVDEIVVRTSGTTGVPTVIRHSDDYLVERAAQRYRMYRAYGVPRYPKVIQVSAKPGRPLLKLHNPAAAGAGAVIAVNFAAVDDENRDVVAATLRTFEADVISGQSMELLAYADEVAAGRLEAPAAQVALAQGDTLLPATRQAIEDTLGLRLYDTYGLQEVGQVAFECPQVPGSYHVNAEAIAVTVDQQGNLRVTSLVNRAMSIVNYLTGDHGTLRGGGCPCGRALPVLQNLQGRSRPLIRARDGRGRQATALQTLISQVFGEQWQVLQPRDGHLILRVTRDADSDRVSRLLRAVDDVYGVDVAVERVPGSDILNDSGKLIRFVGTGQ